MALPVISLVQLAYCSLARPFFNDAAIQNILEVSRRRNAEHNVTGVLLYKSGYVLQVLEGPPAAVRRLFKNIQRDPRHTEVYELYEMPIVEREFPDWSMGFQYANFGFDKPPASFNHLLSDYLNVRPDPDKRGTWLLASFASTTR